MGGWNNNPSAKQYCAVHRCLLQRAGVSPGKQGNVSAQDDTDLLIIPSEGHKRPRKAIFCEPLHSYWDTALSLKMSPFVENILEYISGWVVRKLQQKLLCNKCLNCLVVLKDNKQCNNCSLLQVKDNGALVVPSAAVVRVVQHAERIMRATVDIHFTELSTHLPGACF